MVAKITLSAILTKILPDTVPPEPRRERRPPRRAWSDPGIARGRSNNRRGRAAKDLQRSSERQRETATFPHLFPRRSLYLGPRGRPAPSSGWGTRRVPLSRRTSPGRGRGRPRRTSLQREGRLAVENAGKRYAHTGVPRKGSTTLTTLPVPGRERKTPGPFFWVSARACWPRESSGTPGPSRKVPATARVAHRDGSEAGWRHGGINDQNYLSHPKGRRGTRPWAAPGLEVGVAARAREHQEGQGERQGPQDPRHLSRKTKKTKKVGRGEIRNEATPRAHRFVVLRDEDEGPGRHEEVLGAGREVRAVGRGAPRAAVQENPAERFERQTKRFPKRPARGEIGRAVHRAIVAGPETRAAELEDHERPTTVTTKRRKSHNIDISSFRTLKASPRRTAPWFDSRQLIRIDRYVNHFSGRTSSFSRWRWRRIRIEGRKK